MTCMISGGGRGGVAVLLCFYYDTAESIYAIDPFI